MRLRISAIFLIITFVGLGWAGERAGARKPAPNHYPLNLSIYYPLSINKTKKDSVNLNLSLIYGHVGTVRGIDLSALYSAVGDDMKGVQVTGLAGSVGDSMKGIQAAGLFCIAGDRSAGLQASGLFNITGNGFSGIQGSGFLNMAGDRFSGIQGTGLINFVGDKFAGIQGSGIINFVGDRFSGVQGAGLINFVGDRFAGIQGSGIINFVGDSFKGIQSSGILNFAGDNFSGIQSAGIINFTGGEFKGLQAGTINFTDKLNGLQLGIVNLASHVEGVQLGVVNVSDEMGGTPIGVVNLSRDGRIRWVSWGSSITAFNTGFKFMVKNIYSIVSIGGINVEKDISSSSLSYGFRYGLHLPLKKLYFDMDCGYTNIDNKDYFRSAGEIDRHFFEGRAMLGLDISRHMSIFAGGGTGYMIDHKESFGSGEFTAFFFAGIELFDFNFLPRKKLRRE